MNNDGVLTVRNLELLVADGIVESEAENSFSTESKGKSLYRVLVLEDDVDCKMSVSLVEVCYGESLMSEKIGVVAMRGKVTVGEYPVKLAFIHSKVLLLKLFNVVEKLFLVFGTERFAAVFGDYVAGFNTKTVESGMTEEGNVNVNDHVGFENVIGVRTEEG